MTVTEIISISMLALICIPKYHFTSTIFSGKTVILGIVWVKTRNSEQWTGETTFWETMHPVW